MTTENLPALPDGWVWTTLGQITSDPQYGWTTRAVREGKTHLLRTTDITSGRIDWAKVPFCKEDPPDKEKYLLKDGDVVISRAGSVGYSHLIKNPEEAVFASYLIRFVPMIPGPFFALFLTSPIYWQSISEKSLGIAILNVNASRLKHIPFPLPPLPEQYRIVAKIEELFTKLDAGVEALEKIKAQLKRYRQSVLKYAFEGKLTKEWREEHKHELEPTSVLLERIKTELMSKLGGKYKERPHLDTSELPKLPDNWIWIDLGQLTWSVKDGPHYSPQYADEGIPFITGGNVRPSGVDFDNAKRITPELHAELSKRCKPEKGDILYTKGGTTGIARVNTYDIEFNVWVHVAVLKLVESVDPFYVQHALNSPFCYAQSQRYTHGVGNQDLGLTRMVNIVIGLPPKAEQRQIVSEVNRHLSIADNIERSIVQNRGQAERLHQSILKVAFEGKLVPQDPNDEPASVLLGRITEQRASLQRESSQKERRPSSRRSIGGEATAKRRQITSLSLYEILKSLDKPVTPTALFQASGLEIHTFYEELRREVEMGRVIEHRMDEAEVFLEVRE